MDLALGMGKLLSWIIWVHMAEENIWWVEILCYIEAVEDWQKLRDEGKFAGHDNNKLHEKSKGRLPLGLVVYSPLTIYDGNTGQGYKAPLAPLLYFFPFGVTEGCVRISFIRAVSSSPLQSYLLALYFLSLSFITIPKVGVLLSFITHLFYL